MAPSNGALDPLFVGAPPGASRLVGGRRVRQLTIRTLAAVVAWAAGMLSLYREVLTSGFARLQGDDRDTRLLIYLNERWLTVLKGHGAWRDPGFFYPTTGVLGYSDALFLYQPFYVPLRLLGFDPFLAYQLTLMLLSTIGFASAARFLRRVVGVRFSLSVLGAALFAFSSALGVKVGHGQLYAINLLPVLGLLVADAARSLPARPVRAALSGFAAGLLQALLLFTSFYIGWFTLIAGVVVLACCVLGAGPSLFERARPALQAWRATALAAGAAAAGFAVGIVPFLATYLPILDRSRGRSYEVTKLYGPHPTDLINVGWDNMVWGRVLRAIGFGAVQLHKHERALAVTPLIVAVAVGGAIALLVAGRGPTRARARVVAGLVVGGLLLRLLPIDFGGVSAWRFVWAVIPGAKAIRAAGRLDMVTNVVFIVAVVLVLEASLTTLQARGTRLARAGLAAVVPVALLLCAEQVQTNHYVKLSRSDERAMLASLPPAPASCRGFYVSEPRAGGTVFTAQIDAMLISATTGVPTINGYSGMLPPGWDLLDASKPDYKNRVAAWLQLNGLHRGICDYNLRTRTWSEAPADTG